MAATKSDSHVHYQVRRVKRFDGKKIVTRPTLAQPKKKGAADKTLDFGINFRTEGDALQQASNYCAQVPQKKEQEFFGVVVVKHETDPLKSVAVNRPDAPRPLQVSKRPRRLTGTTTWLYYVNHESNVFYVEPKTHQIGERVTP